MSGFSEQWLALREAADQRARSVALERSLAVLLEERSRPLTIVDLGSGTGANLRRLAPRLSGAQGWRLLDDDAALLAAARRRCEGLRAADGAALSIAIERLDLATAPLETVCSGTTLVTASALLDLVSEPWLDRLADAIASAGAIALFTLDYDGRRYCEPADPLDAAAQRAFDRHQRRDKGFGAAAGPLAAQHFAAALEQCGYRVTRDRADWVLDASDPALQTALIEGWTRAAIEAADELDATEARAQFGAWGQRRFAHVAAGVSRLVVGHTDVLGVPP